MAAATKPAALPASGPERNAHVEAMVWAMRWAARNCSKDGMTGVSEPRAYAMAQAAYDELRDRGVS